MKISEFKAKFFPQETHLSYQLTKLTIISPFFSEYFFEHLVEADVLLVTDFRSKLDADKISLDFPNIKCVLSETNATKDKNIVHAKIFFFEWKNVHVGETRFILLWGSCNATFTELSGGNAEVYSWCDVSRNYPEVINYFGKIRELSLQSKPSGQISSVETQLKTVSLHLPALRLIENINDFESWLESGFLWHPLEHSNFGTLRISLITPLVDTGITKVIKGKGLTIGEAKSVGYSYLQQDILKNIRLTSSDEENYTHDYLRKTQNFSFETIYGAWASEQFYKTWDSTEDNEHILVIQQISKSTEENHLIWINALLELLQETVNEMVSMDKKPHAYFHIIESKETGRISVDTKRYQELLMTQIKNDKKLCQQPYFKHAYCKGGEFAEFPPIRFNKRAWGIFIDSWQKSALKEMRKSAPRNKLAQILKRKINEAEWEKEDKLIKWLMESNNWEEIRPTLLEYHQEAQKDMFK